MGDTFFKTIYQELHIIGEKSFTPREVDVISCVLSGKGEKAIAVILSISSRGVESHTRNIRQKIGCTGRDGIIEFVEKMHKTDHFRHLYQYLLTQSNFIKVLKKIASVIKKEELTCTIFCEKEEERETSFSRKIKQHLKISGIEGIIEKKESMLDPEKILIFVGSIEGLLTFKKKITNPINKTILALTVLKKPQEDSPFKEYVFFEKNENYYLSFFQLLKKLLPTFSLEKFIEEFKSLSVDQKSLPLISKGASIEKNSLFNQKNFTRRKKLVWSAAILLFSSLLIFTLFWIFTPNVKNKSLSINPLYKSSGKKALSWNAPFMPARYIKRNESVEAIWKKFMNPVNTMVGIFGLGGVGKTFLAMHCFHDCKQPYDFKAWFNAESPS